MGRINIFIILSLSMNMNMACLFIYLDHSFLLSTFYSFQHAKPIHVLVNLYLFITFFWVLWILAKILLQLPSLRKILMYGLRQKSSSGTFGGETWRLFFHFDSIFSSFPLLALPHHVSPVTVHKNTRIFSAGLSQQWNYPHIYADTTPTPPGRKR